MVFTGSRRRKWGRRFAILIGLAVCPLVTRAASTHSSVPVRTLRGYLAVVSVSINSRGPFDFLVDTGTNTTLIESDLAAELGLVPVDRMSLTTLTGSEPVPRYFLEEARVGSASVPHLETLAGPLQQLRSLDRNIRGILGMNFLAAFSFRLDYEHRRLEIFDPAESPEIFGGIRVPVEITESCVLVPVESNASRNGVWKLALDSGIPEIAIFQDRLAVDMRHQEGCIGVCTMVVRTNSFRSADAAQTTTDMYIAHTPLRHQSIVVLPNGPEDQRRLEDGLLPASLFRAVFFDRIGRSVVFNPR